MNYYAVERSTDHLAHYGVKGMRWGVRKAIAVGNQKALDRHYRKAAKKLAKLQDIGLNSKKYAAKAAAYGAAAAGTGTLAIGGTDMLGNIIDKPAKSLAKRYAKKHGLSASSGANIVSSTKKSAEYKKYNDISNASKNLKALGESSSGYAKKRKDGKLVSIKNNDLYRVGVGIVSAGLFAKSAQNAYRAANGQKYRAKAYQWKNAMDEAFSGTKYEGKYAIPIKKKRRKSK